MSRGGARKGAGRKPTGKTRAVETFSLKLSTLSALAQSVPGGRRSGFVDLAICDALSKLVRPPAAVPQVSTPKPFETI